MDIKWHKNVNTKKVSVEAYVQTSEAILSSPPNEATQCCKRLGNGFQNGRLRLPNLIGDLDGFTNSRKEKLAMNKKIKWLIGAVVIAFATVLFISIRDELYKLIPHKQSVEKIRNDLLKSLAVQLKAKSEILKEKTESTFERLTRPELLQEKRRKRRWNGWPTGKPIFLEAHSWSSGDV